MSERITACKSLRSFLAAFARIIISCRFGAGCRRSKVFFVSDFLIKRMRKFAALVRYGIFFIAAVAVANCRLRSVLRAGGVIVGNVIRKTMPERITACKSFRSFLAAFARVIIRCFFVTCCGCGKIFVADNLFCITMVQLRIYIFYSILFVTTVALCRFRSVLRAGGVIVGNVIRKTMSERRAVFKSFRAFLAAFARIIIGCFFGAGCVGRLIFVRYDLFVKRMNMLIFFTTG